MNKKVIGFCLGIIEFIIMISIIKSYYKGAVNGIMAGVFVLIIFQFRLYDKLYREKQKTFLKKYKNILVYNFALFFVFGLLLPKYTYKQAKNIVVKEYKNDIQSFNEHKPYYYNTVPIKREGIKDILVPTRFYYFSIRNAKEEIINIMVNPLDGHIVQLQEAYWDDKEE